MRIAVVAHFTSPGGGARFLRGLCLGLLDQAGVEEIGLFIDAESAEREGLAGLLPDTAHGRLLVNPEVHTEVVSIAGGR